MSKKRVVLDFKRPKLFEPAVQRSVEKNIVFIQNKSLSEVQNSNIRNSSSFKYDEPGSGLKSTQQLGINWALFENHTFFNSAEAKTNVAFDSLINRYPFDGTGKEIENFMDALTGFEKYVYDEFPKNKGYLNFSGTQAGEIPGDGTYISVVDSAGSLFPEFSRLDSGQSILDPKNKSFSFEMQLLVSSQSNNNQVVCQRMTGSEKGFMLALSHSVSPNSCSLLFSVLSESMRMSASMMIPKGKFNHICVTYDRSSVKNRLFLYLNETLRATSSIANIEKFNFKNTRFLIGSGTTVNLRGPTEINKFIPRQTFSGSIDEFRFFYTIRPVEDQELYAKKSIFSDDNLKLYFKFNEPSGTIGPNAVVLDYSGNSLHSLISNYIPALRSTSSVENPMKLELLENCPVLFPAYSPVKDLNEKLLLSASSYDLENPNLITRLIPPHYFWEGEVFQGLDSEQGTIMQPFTGSSIPGSGDLGSSQIMSAFLFIWAKYFDELKLFLDTFSDLLHLDYDTINSVPDQFLPFVAKYYGIGLPAFFREGTFEQIVSGDNLLDDISTSVHSLNHIQNQIWRRILTNLNDLIKSKGTRYGIEALIRAMGTNPQIFRIREFGGPTTKNLRNLTEKRTEVSTLSDFSGTLASVTLPENIDAQGFHASVPHLESLFLSSSRIEIGFPNIQGTYVDKDRILIKSDRPGRGKGAFTFRSPHGISNNVSDGLLTSGSWTFEGVYQFPLTRSDHYQGLAVTESLMRIHSTGSSTYQYCILNLLASTGSIIKLITSPSTGSRWGTGPLLEMPLTGVNIFDGNKWNISFGRVRNDDKSVGLTSSIPSHSSSYFLRAARQQFGTIYEYYSTASLFVDDTFNNISYATSSVWQQINPATNVSGTFLVIGSQSITKESTNGYHLNMSSIGDFARQTKFSGEMGHIKFWSQGITDTEWKEHILNFKSRGVKDPLVNFNFNAFPTGAFGRLRLDVSTDQPITESNSLGDITMFDFSQNGLFLTGSGFEKSARIIKPATFYYSHLSPKFDIVQTDNKFRVRSLQTIDPLLDDSYVQPAPVYEVPLNEEPDDDTRFTVEISSAQALDDDIMNIFSTLDFFDNALGQPRLLFKEYYTDIRQLRKIYFNRLDQKINLKHFFEFFKWFDASMGTLIEQFIPRKANYPGLNFVVESHALERPKFRYLYDQLYLSVDESHRMSLRDGDDGTSTGGSILPLGGDYNVELNPGGRSPTDTHDPSDGIDPEI